MLRKSSQCVCARVRACVCVCLFVSVCACMRARAFWCVCVRVRACVRECVRACMRACVCLSVYMCVFIVQTDTYFNTLFVHLLFACLFWLVPLFLERCVYNINKHTTLIGGIPEGQMHYIHIHSCPYYTITRPQQKIYLAVNHDRTAHAVIESRWHSN